MFNKIKAGAQEAATTAGIEAMFLQGKKSGYHHPPEVEAQIQIMRENREEIPLLREDIGSILSNEKNLATAEVKAGSDFTSMAEHPTQHPQLKVMFQLVGALHASLSSNRYNYHATAEMIKEEWKGMENVELKDIKNKQELVNRAWVTKKYYEKEKKAPKAAECEGKYKVLVSELVHQVHELREKKETLLPGYLLNYVQAQMEFHRKALEELVKCESALRNIGTITPIKFTGYDQFNPGMAITEDGSPRATPTPTPAPLPSRPPPPSVPSGGVRAKGLYAFQAQSPDELNFNPGDILTIISQTGEWWTAELNGRRGLIPGNYVQLI